MLALLPPATRELHVFGDGSFQQCLHLGAWAYRIPQFELEQAFCGTGSFCEEFEFRAIVAGLRRLVSVDRTERCINIHSDSAFVNSVVTTLSQRGRLQERKSLARVRDLYDEATALVGTRRVAGTKACATEDDHRRCHHNAVNTLRQAIRDEPGYAAYLALLQEEQRRETLRAERAQLDKRMEKIEHDLLVADIRISALRSIAVRPGIDLTPIATDGKEKCVAASRAIGQ